MKDQPNNEDQPDAQDKRHVLAEIPQGTHSSRLVQPPESSTPGIQAGEQPAHLGSMRKKPGHVQPSAEASPPGQYGPPATEGRDTGLQLPADALVALRRVGGFRFTSKQVTIYQDGRVEMEGAGVNADSAHSHSLSDAEFAEVYRALEAADFANLPSQAGRQSPDGYAYEIAADLSGNHYSAVAYDGGIPAQLAPLLKFLSAQLQ